MTFDIVITLIGLVQDVDNPTDNVGNPVFAEEHTEVYANQQSIRQSEFYQAATAGLKPAVTFVINAYEYNGQTRLVHERIFYRVLRTYKSLERPEEIELVCERVLADGE